MSQSPSTTEELVGRLVDATVGTLEMFSIHVGRELGAYRALAGAGERGLSVAELAAATAISSRYALEWLEQQAVAGLLDHVGDGAERRFVLPSGYEAVLVEDDSAFHVSPFADMIAGIAGVLARLPEAYRSGAGVSYADYGPLFRKGQGGINRPLFATELGDWFAAMSDVEERLAGDDVRIADVGCGEGWSTIALARRFPNATVVGFDLDEASVRVARANAEEAGLNIAFEVADAAGLPSGFDFVLVFEALHDFARPVEVLSALRSALADGGALLVVDERVAHSFTAPGDTVERLMYGWSVNHCLPAAMAEQPSAGLGTVLRADAVRQLAEEAGFGTCVELAIENDFFRFYRMGH